MTLTKLLHRLGTIFSVCCLSLLLATNTESLQAATIGWNQDAAGPYDYNDPNNWVDGSINGIWDSSLTILGTQTATFGADTVLPSGLNFSYVGGFNVNLLGTGANRTVTLGGDITVNTASNTRVITVGSVTANQGVNVDLGGTTRTFTVGTGRTLGFVNAISNGSIVANGGTMNFSGVNTYFGSTTITSGNFSLNGANGSSANSDFTLQITTGSTPTLTFNSGTNGNPGTTRARSVSLNGTGNAAGALLNITGNATANSVETITNALMAAGGFSTVTLTPNGARNSRLVAGSFARNNGSTILMRGNDLGVNTIASQTAGDANIQFVSAPLVGGGGLPGNSTIGILKGAYGDIASNGNGSNGGLLTHDSTFGVRLLNPTTEYQSAIANGQAQLDNVLYARSSGGASQDINLSSGTTTINSLSFKISGAGTNSGVTISGDAGAILRLNSGMVFASQLVGAANATDAMTISVPTLDLNGQEGVFISFTNGSNQGNTPAPLQINSVISNDGGNGVTIGGTGQIIYGGSLANSYTGPTTLNSGVLRLNKTAGADIGLTTDLIMNGGTLLKNSNAIANNASVTINAGNFVMDTTTSSGNNGHQETVLNFTMNGGGLSTNSGSGQSLTMLGNLTLNANFLRLGAGGDIIVNGTTKLNGGTLHTRESSGGTLNAFNILQDVNITNTATSAYTAMVLHSHGTNQGGRLTLNGNLSFTGNSTNANTVLISSSDTALANQSVFALEGNRTFNIGNGAAAVDLTIVPALVNGSATGSLTKTGAGTLALNGVNTYNGATAVNNGTLQVNGALQGTSGVSVAAGASLSGNGSVFATVGGAGSIDPGTSPGILTTTQVNTAAGMDFNFEFTEANAQPNWVTPQNDVLRITDGTPFTQTMNANNVISLYLDVNSISFGDVFYGGFYTDGGDVLSDVSLASVVAYLESTTGSVSYLGKNYNPVLGGFFTINTAANSQFAAGGFLTEFTFSASQIPEPSTALLLGMGVMLLQSVRRQRRRVA